MRSRNLEIYKGPSATSDLPKCYSSKYYTESLLIEGEPTREEDETGDQSVVLIVSSDYKRSEYTQTCLDQTLTLATSIQSHITFQARKNALIRM
jgi:hypothetical protein